MLEELTKKTLIYVRPNIERFRVLKDLVNNLVDETGEVESFLQELDRLIEETDDIVLETDMRIFKNAFMKFLG